MWRPLTYIRPSVTRPARTATAAVGWDSTEVWQPLSSPPVCCRLARHHNHIRNIRRHFLYRVSNELAKTHDRLVIEDLNVSGMLRNHRLAQAIGDAGWAEFARQLRYKTDWRNRELAIEDRWYPSSQVCSRCGNRNHRMTLSDRVFICDCGYSDDRDRNAAANLARWAEQHHLEPRTPKHGGRVTNVRRRDGADRHVTRVGETTSEDVGTDVQATPVARTEDAREGRCHTPTRLCDTLQSQVSSVVAVRKASRSSRHCAGVFLSGSMPVYSPR